VFVCACISLDNVLIQAIVLAEILFMNDVFRFEIEADIDDTLFAKMREAKRKVGLFV